MNDARTTRKQSKCNAYDNTKKPVCTRVACNCFYNISRTVKAESEAGRSDHKLQKIYSVLEVDEKTEKKKHEENEREWREKKGRFHGQ